MIEEDVGEFIYIESKTEENPMSEHGVIDGKNHMAFYDYQGITVVASITKLHSISAARDYLSKELEADFQVFSLDSLEGNEVYKHNNHFIWLSGTAVVYVGVKQLQDLDRRIEKLKKKNYTRGTPPRGTPPRGTP